MSDDLVKEKVKVKEIGCLQVSVSFRATLNLRKGVVKPDDFATESREELGALFEPEGVTEI